MPINPTKTFFTVIVLATLGTGEVTAHNAFQTTGGIEAGLFQIQNGRKKSQKPVISTSHPDVVVAPPVTPATPPGVPVPYPN